MGYIGVGGGSVTSVGDFAALVFTVHGGARGGGLALVIELLAGFGQILPSSSPTIRGDFFLRLGVIYLTPC